MSNSIEPNLNEIIVQAVQAKIEMAVATALAGNEILGQYVAAALNQPIEVGSYNKVKTTYLKHTIDQALQGAVKQAINEFIGGEAEFLRAEVAWAMRKQSAAIADMLVTSWAERAKSGYGLSVEVRYPNS